jgi:hypothetical protein
MKLYVVLRVPGTNSAVYGIVLLYMVSCYVRDRTLLGEVGPLRMGY